MVMVGGSAGLVDQRVGCLGYEIVLSRMLGSGDFGSVWDLKPLNDGKRWILKVSQLTSRNPKDAAKQMESFQREVYFLQRLKGTGLVPELKSAEICNDEGLQVMERFDGSLQDLGDIQAKIWKLRANDKVLTGEQLAAIVNLVKDFDQHRVYHGDLKRGNILYSLDPQNGAFRAVIADFGFSGAHNSPYYPLTGFTRNYDCPSKTITDANGDMRLEKPIPKTLLPFINRLQLYTDFIGGRRTFIVSKHGNNIAPISATRLATSLGLTKRILAKFRLYCPQAPRRLN